MKIQTQKIQAIADFPGTLREHGASISRLRRPSFGTDITPASQSAMTIPPTASVLRH